MKLPIGKVALLAGAAAILVPASGMAQEVRNLDNARSDVQIFEGEVSTTPVRYRYTIPARTRLQVDVVPATDSELDPVLTITDARTGEVLAEDDDSGGNLASRASVIAEQRARQVEISVSSFAFLSGEESTGTFELQLRSSDWSPPVVRPVTFGSDTRGRLAAGERQLFTITGGAGQMVEVALVAIGEDLDPTLNFYAGRGTEGELLQSDDDGGNELNSLIRVLLPKDGVYTIEATPYGETYGEFTLRVAPLRPTVAEQSQGGTIGLGETISGYVATPDYSAYSEEELYDADELVSTGITYRLSDAAIAAIRGGAGQVTINMTQPEFGDPDFPSGIDPFVEVGLETPMGLASLASDDDGGGDLNARLPLDLGALAADGDLLERLRIRVTTIGSGGEFSLSLTEGKQEVVVPDYEDYAAEAVEDAAAEEFTAPPPPIRVVPAD